MHRRLLRLFNVIYLLLNVIYILHFAIMSIIITLSTINLLMKWGRIKMFKSKRVVDERIQKESDCLYEKMAYLLLVMTISSLMIKVALGKSMMVYSLEVISVIIAGLIFLIGEWNKGILFVKKTDDALKDMHREVMRKVYMAMTEVYITGGLIILCIDKSADGYIVSFLILWFIPTLIVTIFSIKNGWLVWGTKKREKIGKTELAKRTAIGALFFGIFMGGEFLFKDGRFEPAGLLWILGLGASWGLLFYFLFSIFISAAEKQSYKKLDEIEETNEK